MVGRTHEIGLLEATLSSDKAELIAIYGRRRVGKTFLVRQFFENRICFEVTGLFQGGMVDQLANFTKELDKRTSTNNKKPTNWLDAFTLLEQYIDSLSNEGKKVIFIDEFPWMATKRSKFLMAFANFWNSYSEKRADLIVVICGSAASYMVQKIIRNKGGLHNRISQKIRLLPFNLQETELFLKSRNIDLTRYDILQLYMAVGGVPHYLEKVQRGKSVAQNLDRMCFEKDGVLSDEFNLLFASLFDDSDKHKAIIRALANTRKGLTRDGIIEKSGLPSGGDLSLKLMELIESGFVTEYPYFQNKAKQTLYRLSDEYSLFYLKFMENGKYNGSGTWLNLQTSQSYVSWSGFSFEGLCLKHVHQLKKGLQIQAIRSESSSWFNENAQIDLVIDRADNIINLCEMKFANSPFTIDKTYAQNLRNKISEFKNSSGTRKGTHLVMVTTFGTKENPYSLELVQNDLKMDCLFE
ncbi:MAG: ATP-binding protein [Flavobacteriales bacterium]|nr:ATP-binding protein [Flavobacteriales bacterium]